MATGFVSFFSAHRAEQPEDSEGSEDKSIMANPATPSAAKGVHETAFAERQKQQQKVADMRMDLGMAKKELKKKKTAQKKAWAEYLKMTKKKAADVKKTMKVMKATKSQAMKKKKPAAMKGGKGEDPGSPTKALAGNRINGIGGSPPAMKKGLSPMKSC